MRGGNTNVGVLKGTDWDLKSIDLYKVSFMGAQGGLDFLIGGLNPPWLRLCLREGKNLMVYSKKREMCWSACVPFETY